MSAAELLARAKDVLTRNPRKSLQWAQQAWKELATSGPPEQVADCRLCLGHAHHVLSQAAEAVVQYGEALVVAREAQLSQPEIEAHLGLGASYRLLGRSDSALDHLGQAWKLAESRNDELGEMQVSIAIGEVYLALDRPHEALDYFFRARTRVQGSPRRAELIDILLSLGSDLSDSQTQRRGTRTAVAGSRSVQGGRQPCQRIAGTQPHWSAVPRRRRARHQRGVLPREPENLPSHRPPLGPAERLLQPRRSSRPARVPRRRLQALRKMRRFGAGPRRSV